MTGRKVAGVRLAKPALGRNLVFTLTEATKVLSSIGFTFKQMLPSLLIENWRTEDIPFSWQLQCPGKG